MANRAYVSVWCKGWSEERILDLFEGFLATVPFSAEQPGFTSLVVRAVDFAETPVIEHDLRARPASSEEIVVLVRDHLNADSAYEVEAHWDLWAYELDAARWQLHPQRLEIICYGEEYDEGASAELGHIHAKIGFEHLFTGHAGLLGVNGRSAVRRGEPAHPAEAAFLAAMAQPGRLKEYHQRTRENIHRLLEWMRQVESALPVERYRLWSEGEEDFEARLDEILAVR